jgi:membrane protein implicated in regulation of membrane protease activity
MRVRRWEAPDEPLPARPYRNTAIFHAVLAGLIVLVAWLTAGDIGTAIVVAIGFFVVATSWSFWRWRQRLEEERLKQERRDRGSAARRGAR